MADKKKNDVICSSCNGRGWTGKMKNAAVKDSKNNMAGYEEAVKVDCPDCKGKGRIPQ